MVNPFYTASNRPMPNQNGNSVPNLKDIYKMLSTSNNPLQLFQNIAQNNPNMKPIIDLLNNGYSPKQVFDSLCKQRGINPQEFINSLRN